MTSSNVPTYLEEPLTKSFGQNIIVEAHTP
jgi:hypothetical protein